MEKTAILIQGTNGSGKTTLAIRLATELRAVRLSQDMFYFDMHPYDWETNDHFVLGNAHLWSCFSNAVTHEKNIILEGSLVTLSSTINTFSLQPYLDELSRNDYNVHRLRTFCSYDVAHERMQARAQREGPSSLVPYETYEAQRSAIAATVPSDVPVIETDQLSSDEVFARAWTLLS